MIQNIIVVLIVAAAAAWPLRAWIAPPPRRAFARGGAAPSKGGCENCDCGR
jgi:hypothetical protein